jgi:hypothetical protein
LLDKAEVEDLTILQTINPNSPTENTENNDNQQNQKIESIGLVSLGPMKAETGHVGSAELSFKPNVAGSKSNSSPKKQNIFPAKEKDILPSMDSLAEGLKADDNTNNTNNNSSDNTTKAVEGENVEPDTPKKTKSTGFVQKINLGLGKGFNAETFKKVRS